MNTSAPAFQPADSTRPVKLPDGSSPTSAVRDVRLTATEIELRRELELVQGERNGLREAMRITGELALRVRQQEQELAELRAAAQRTASEQHQVEAGKLLAPLRANLVESIAWMDGRRNRTVLAEEQRRLGHRIEAFQDCLGLVDAVSSGIALPLSPREQLARAYDEAAIR